MSIRESQKSIWSGSNLKQVEYYFNFETVVSRSKWFAEQLKAYEFDSIYEPGLFSGRNLKYILDEFPNVACGGLDINKIALDFAKNKIPSADLEYCDFINMNTDKKYDIVFTSGVLIHIPKEDIVDVVKKCIDKSIKYVMHIESCNKNKVLTGPASTKPKKIKDKLQWEPDIKSIYNSLGYSDLTISDIPKELQTTGATHFIVVKI